MLVKKMSIALASLLLLTMAAQAQLTIQSGATFTMQTGSQVSVQGSVDNAGVLNNDGSLKVQGNFSNSGTYAGVGTTGVLEMYGTGNSDLNAGSSTIANLLINKAGVTDLVRLRSSATVSTAFTLTNGVFSTDPINNPSFVLSSPVTANYTFAAGKEIIGSVRRTSWTAGAVRVFNAPNMQVTTNSGTAPTQVTVTMIPQTGSGDPTQTEREVKRKFNFAQTGGSGFTADIRYPYLSSELNTNTEAKLVPWRLTTGEWNARLTPIARDVANDYVSTTGIPAVELTDEWKLADPNYTMNVTAFLRGAWNNPTGLMRTVLNSNSLLPLSHPYTGAPYNAPAESVASIPNANIVDWVLVELRKPTSGLPENAIPSTLIGRRAAFLLNNGTVVDLDGVTPISVPISKQGTGNFIVIRHRNHLAAMSVARASNETGDFTNNFSVLANVYQKPTANSFAVLLLSTTGAGSSLYGFWQGDANNNGNVTSADISLINSAIAGSSLGNTNIYSNRDVNLDRNVTSADLSLTNFSTSNLAQTSSSRSTNNNNPQNNSNQPINNIKPVASHVPDEITNNN
jgi:hypothetical protein